MKGSVVFRSSFHPVSVMSSWMQEAKHPVGLCVDNPVYPKAQGRSIHDKVSGSLDNIFGNFTTLILCSLVTLLMYGLQLASLRFEFLDYSVWLWANYKTRIILALCVCITGL